MSKTDMSDIADGIATYRVAEAITDALFSHSKTSNRDGSSDADEGEWRVDDYSTDEYYKIVFTVTIPKK